AHSPPPARRRRRVRGGASPPTLHRVRPGANPGASVVELVDPLLDLVLLVLELLHLLLLASVLLVADLDAVVHLVEGALDELDRLLAVPLVVLVGGLQVVPRRL